MNRGVCPVQLLSEAEARSSRRCRYCRGPLAGVGTWCGRDCKDLFNAATGDVRTIRRLLLARDLGRCALCSLDTGLLARTLSRLMGFVGFRLPWAAAIAAHEVLGGLGWTENQARKAIDLYATSVRPSDLWEVDHVVPAVLGGLNDLSNLRTLCIPDHAGVTRQLARERAAARASCAGGGAL